MISQYIEHPVLRSKPSQSKIQPWQTIRFVDEVPRNHNQIWIKTIRFIDDSLEVLDRDVTSEMQVRQLTNFKPV